jgi:carboxylate-amine ligase
VIQALVVWLARRHDAGELFAAAPTWRLEENRWSACRHGVEGEMLDAETGERRSTRACLEWLLETLAPIAGEFGAASQLDQAAAMIEANGAIEQRRAAEQGGARGVAEWLAERFLEPWAG